MDFRSANTQPQPSQQPAPVFNNNPSPALPARPKKEKHGGSDGITKWLRISAVVLLFSITVLVIAVISGVAFTKDTDGKQSKFVDTTGYQAVFLTNGQFYFGKLTSFGSDYIRLQDIFYLIQNTSTDTKTAAASTNYTLVKLGCQLPNPSDQMIIQRSQVSFWENLQPTGKVVTSIKDYQTQAKTKTQAELCGTTSDQTQATGKTSTTTTTPAASTTTH